MKLTAAVATAASVLLLVMTLVDDVTAGTRKPSNVERQLRQQLRATQNRLNDLRGVMRNSADFSRNYTTSGWYYLPGPNKFYQGVFELTDWTTAGSLCKRLNSKAHLVVVETEIENEAIRAFLADANIRVWRTCGYNPGFPLGYWTSGQRVDPTSCTSEFVWKPSAGVEIPLTYTGWNDTQPDCANGNEMCIHYGAGDEWLQLNWNDFPCSAKQWFICELDQ